MPLAVRLPRRSHQRPPPVYESPNVTQSKAAWEGKWDNSLNLAGKEGRVVVYNSWVPEVRNSLSTAFKNKYGIIDVEMVPFARGGDFAARVQAEKRGGINLADILSSGATTLILVIKPAGLLGPLEPQLLLSEVTDPALWINRKIPYMDKDKLTIGMSAGLNFHVYYNTGLIKKGEITSFRDLLKPEYKNKVIMNDPTVSGVGISWLAHLAYNVWNEQEAVEFFKQLLANGVEITRDNRLQVEWVARGKYAIGVAALPDVLEEFMRLGTSLEVAKIKEPLISMPAGSGISMPLVAPHPNAAKVFINWILSKEGQTIFSKSFGGPSFRIDVPTTDINPIFIPVPGQTSSESEDLVLYRGSLMVVFKKAMDEVRK